MQDLQATQIAELQVKLDKLESQQGPTQDESEECLLSPAVGMNHMEALLTETYKGDGWTNHLLQLLSDWHSRNGR